MAKQKPKRTLRIHLKSGAVLRVRARTWSFKWSNVNAELQSWELGGVSIRSRHPSFIDPGQISAVEVSRW